VPAVTAAIPVHKAVSWVENHHAVVKRPTHPPDSLVYSDTALFHKWLRAEARRSRVKVRQNSGGVLTVTLLRIDARADWRVNHKPATLANVPILSVAPGESPTDWQTEKVRAVSDLKKLIDAVNDAKGITFLMDLHYAVMVFPNHRDIDFISIEFNQREVGSGGGPLLTTTCKDLTVTKTMQLTAHLVELAKANHESLDGVDPATSQLVTLRFSDGGFSTG
jgi:hypothetical protein